MVVIVSVMLFPFRYHLMTSPRKITDRFIASDKPKEVAFDACMRKLLVILNPIDQFLSHPLHCRETCVKVPAHHLSGTFPKFSMMGLFVFKKEKGSVYVRS